ncbi:MAG: archaetidylserine decarboxylase [Acidobacteriota bacterium]
MGLLLRLIERSDQKALSEFAGRAADSRLLAPVLKALFVSAYRPDLSEAEKGYGDYPTCNALFTRALRDGRRPIDDAALVCPADGAYGAAGAIEEGMLLQAKGKRYALEALLGPAAPLAPRLLGGSFLTVYLSPRDYHRFHAPCGGRLAAVERIPGRLLPVNAGAVASIDDLFARNDRTLFVIEDGAGVTGSLTVLVAVAAFLVSGVVATAPPGPLARGSELGYFRFGSTVVVLAGPELPRLAAPPGAARVGRGLTGSMDATR